MDYSKMRSSPPRGGTPKVLVSSPAASRYELDLDALDSSSITSSPVAHRVVPEVLSDDIDGPSDFTLNMMDYLKGPALRRSNSDSDVAITTGTPSMIRNSGMHLQPTVEDYSSPVRPSNPTPLGGRSPCSEATPRGTIGRSSIISPVQSHGGASNYLMSQIERLRSDLATEKEERAAEKAAHAAEIERLNAQHSRELQAATSELRATRDAHTTEIRRITAQYSQQLRATFEAAASDARNNLAITQAAEMERVEAEHSERLRAATITAQHKQKTAHANEMAKMESKYSNDIRAATAANEHRDTVHAAEVAQVESKYSKDLEAATAATERNTAAHAAEIAQLKSKHSYELKAATAATGDYTTSHAAEIAALESKHSKELQAALAATEHSAALHAAEIENLVADHKEFNQAMDTAITEKVRAREERYKSKVSSRDAEIQQLRSKMAELEKLNRGISNELMRAWGREEFGDTGEMQKFRYKYAKAAKA